MNREMTAEALAKMNDRLRRTMPIGQLNIDLAPKVATSPDRPLIIKVIREFKDFDSDIDVSKDHSIGVVVVHNDAYVFRFIYGDERYDYANEVGQRTLSIMHVSEFRSLRLEHKVQTFVRRFFEQEVSKEV